MILTPDLDAYDLIAPDLLPGLDDELVLKGWQIKQSLFSYRTHNYNTNFGLDDFVGQQDVPEFYFNVELRRNFLDSFIAYLVPLIVIAIMMFAILLVPNEHTEQEVFGVLSFIAALLSSGFLA